MNLQEGYYRINSAPIDFDRQLRLIKEKPGYYKEIKLSNVWYGALIKPFKDFGKDLMTLFRAPVA